MSLFMAFKCFCKLELFDRIIDDTKRLWGPEAAGGYQPQVLRENIYLAPSLGKHPKVSWRWGNDHVPKS